MAYIGRDVDKISNVEVLDNITFDGSSSYTLQKNSVNFTPSSANTLLVSINGVVQAGNFTVSGSTIDFGVAIAGTSTCDFILHYGVGLITAPSDGTVTTAKLADSSVSLAKLTATGTKDATTFLRGDNTFAAAGLNGWSEDGANNNLLPANASAGIYLGVNSATASNLLDDYEEGTWTPTFTNQDGTEASNYVNNSNGQYIKIGKMVYVNFLFAVGTITTGPTSIYAGIGGFPFIADGDAGGSPWYTNIDVPNGPATFQISDNRVNGIFYSQRDDLTYNTISPGAISSNDVFYMTFSYKTD